jgi:hypothetical protein
MGRHFLFKQWISGLFPGSASRPCGGDDLGTDPDRVIPVVVRGTQAFDGRMEGDHGAGPVFLLCDWYQNRREPDRPDLVDIAFGQLTSNDCGYAIDSQKDIIE